MKIRSSLVAAALLLCAGCANVRHEARCSDGLLDFAWALAGGPRRDVVPVERFSDHAGEIVTAHAEAAGPSSTRVSGTVRPGFDYSKTTHAHIDVKVIGADNRLIAALATDYFPRPIPRDYRGQPSRGSFSARLPLVPAAGSTIRVAFHQTRRADCEFAHPPAIGKP